MDSRFNTSMTKSKKKQFLFFRRLPPPPKGEFGGLEKLMFDWFERVDYNTSEVVLVVTKGWGERFKSEADQRQLSLKVEELPFDYFKIGPLQRFFDMFNFLKSYRPAGILFFQGYFEEFGMPEILAAALKTKGHVFMHENMGSIEPPKSSSKKYFGFIPGIGLWWQYYMFCIRFRANICKNILTVSEEIKDRYINWWKYPKNKVMVAYHGVDSKIFFPDLNQGQVLRQKFNLPLQDPVFMTMSRITSIKRLDRAIEAFNIVFQEKSNVHLVLFGSGPLERECQELAARLPC